LKLSPYLPYANNLLDVTSAFPTRKNCVQLLPLITASDQRDLLLNYYRLFES